MIHEEFIYDLVDGIHMWIKSHICLVNAKNGIEVLF